MKPLGKQPSRLFGQAAVPAARQARGLSAVTGGTPVFLLP